MTSVIYLHPTPYTLHPTPYTLNPQPLVENYLRKMTSEDLEPARIHPQIAELAGILKSNAEFDKDDYAAYLARKYK